MKVLCAYCGTRPAVNRDHVVPKVIRAKYQRRLTVVRDEEVLYAPARPAIPPELLETVPACFECNHRKGTRKLVPPSWADKLPALRAAIPGHWRVWDGNPMAAAFREVYK